MPQERTRKIVVTGVLGAISIFLALTPLGFIPWFGGISLTIMHVPAIIGAILEGPVVGLFVGLIFGIFSMIRAATSPQGPGDLLFLNPLVAILPRMLFAPVAWLVWRALQRVPAVGLVVSGIVGSLTHTALVLGMIGLLGTLGLLDVTIFGGALWAALGGIFVTSGLPEAAASAVLVLLIVSVWRQIRVGRRQGSKVS